MKAGFIGLGAMGLPMASNILKSGIDLSVWSRRRGAADSILRQGAEWADSPANLGRSCDVVITMVTASRDVEEIVAGEQGVLTSPKEGLVILDMSTISPSTSRTLAHLARSQGCTFLDAPVSGGTQGAEAGTLTIMIGGDEAAIEQVRPVLEAMGRRIFHAGPSGAGEVVKLANNVLVGVIAAATCEALLMGVKAGVPVETLSEIIGASTGASWQLANQLPLRAFNGSFQPGFMTDLLDKDLGLALDLGGELQTPLLFTSLARQLYASVKALGWGACDYTAVLRLLESVAGVEVRTGEAGGAAT